MLVLILLPLFIGTDPIPPPFKDLTSLIVFTNGLNDGWSEGSILTNLSDSLIVRLTSACLCDCLH